MIKSIEEICVTKIEAGIRGIRLGTKTPRDTNCAYFLNKLKIINIEQYDDLMSKYISIVKEYNKRSTKVEY